MNGQEQRSSKRNIITSNSNLLKPITNSFVTLTSQLRMDNSEFLFPQYPQFSIDFQKSKPSENNRDSVPLVDPLNIRQTFDFNSENSDEEVKNPQYEDMFNTNYPSLIRPYEQQTGFSNLFLDSSFMRNRFYMQTIIPHNRNMDSGIETMDNKPGFPPQNRN